jgi:N-acetylmuramic acid 6-phosphate etherase
MQKTTEQTSHYRHLEQMSTSELLVNINKEDQTVPHAIEKVIPIVEKLVDEIASRMITGGRLFSGRLGIVDASECPPTFGVPQGMVVGLIAGGDAAIRKAVEHAEDDTEQGWKDLLAHEINEKDTVIGIAASGTTPYVIGALKTCRAHSILTGCITCNSGSPVAAEADIAIEIVVGPEFVTGSTRMKSGTAQKLCLNMISTAVMIKLGRVEDNKMVNMQLSNDKLIDRGTKMIIEQTGLAYEAAKALLLAEGSVKKAVDRFKK